MYLAEAIKQVRVLVLLPVIVAVSLSLGLLDEKLGFAIVFWTVSLLIAFRIVLSATYLARRMIALDLARCAAAGGPKDLSVVTLAAVFLAVATPVVALAATLAAWENSNRWFKNVAQFLASMWVVSD